MQRYYRRLFSATKCLLWKIITANTNSRIWHCFQAYCSDRFQIHPMEILIAIVLALSVREHASSHYFHQYRNQVIFSKYLKEARSF